MKKIVSLFLILNFALLPVCAKNIVKTTAQVHTEFDILNNDIKIIEFSPDENIKISDNVDIPPKAKIKARIIQSQKERRWHKSGFLVCKLMDYTLEGVTVDISQYDTYLILRKYEAVNAKEASITAAELIVMTGASLFAPGVDIGYFFAKGAIQRKKHPNWFRAGVMNAYDNSICWFWLKGKPINLSQDDTIKLKYIESLDARNLSARIGYRKDKTAFRQEKKIVIKEVKDIKKEFKNEVKENKYQIAQNKKQEKKILKEQKKEARLIAKEAKRHARLAQKNKK